MSFQSPLFLCVFLPGVLAMYWLGPRRVGWQNALLLLGSWVFVWTWGPRLFPFVIMATAVNYGGGRLLEALRVEHDSDEAKARGRGARWVLAAAVSYDLGQLILIKYLGFFASTVSTVGGVFGLPLTIAAPSWALPLGISFWTLQQVGYLVDVYYGRVAACRALLPFATFSAFFPQMQAGPIARSELIGQFLGVRRPSVDDFRTGAFRFFRGYVGRFLIAAVLGDLLVDRVFSNAGEYTTTTHWLALVGYAGQVFCDFAGYSEMAIGVALMFGIRLQENFEYPFLARNLMEFWKHWHMTLTNWLFDYIYSPLMTGRTWLRGRLDLGLIITFLVSGLWHGAAWTFVLWGGLQGVGLVVQRHFDEAYRMLCRKDRSWVARRKTRVYQAAAWAITQAFFVVSLVPFRAGSFGEAAAFASGLLGHGKTSAPPLGITGFVNVFVCVSLLVGYYALRGRRLAVPAVVRGVVYGLLVVYMAIFMPYSKGTFIYAQF
jgi:alginate O-acetyltransferase complex protein AlgI